MLTIIQDQPSLGTAHITWCSGTLLHAYPLTSIFHMIWGIEKHWLCWLLCCQVTWTTAAKPSRKCKNSTLLMSKRQKQYYDRKANAILPELGDLVLAKANAYKGKRKVKDQWEEELYEVLCQVTEGVSSNLMKNKQTGTLMGSPPETDFFSLHSWWRAVPFVWSCKLSRQGALPPP